MKRAASFAALLILLTVIGCKLGPNYVRPPVPAPEGWREKEKTDSTLANTPWWELFKDPTLQSLIRTALAENKNAAIALERIQEARAQLGIAKADYYPHVDGSATAANLNPSDNAFPVETESESHGYYILKASVSWELDFFGRVRRANEAQRAILLATEDAYRNAVIILVSDVAAAYVDMRGMDLELQIARDTLKSREEYVSYAKSRFEGGVTPELDWRQAEAEYYRTKSIVSDLERQIRITENALSVLLGKPPGEIPRGDAIRDQPILPEIPTGLPSQLLERRPDILAAEQVLVAENARIGEAKALMFPQISLTGSYGVVSRELSSLIESASQTWTLVPNLMQSIFDAGKNKNRVRAQESRQKQAVLGYQQAILLSFREVEDSLTTFTKSGEQRESEGERVKALEKVYMLSDARYRGGVSNYLEVLDAQRSLFTAQLDEVDSIRAHEVALVRLYKALGGGWPYAPEQQAEPQPAATSQQ